VYAESESIWGNRIVRFRLESRVLSQGYAESPVNAASFFFFSTCACRYTDGRMETARVDGQMFVPNCTLELRTASAQGATWQIDRVCVYASSL
jgi:hypothetical protein